PPRLEPSTRSPSETLASAPHSARPARLAAWPSAVHSDAVTGRSSRGGGCRLDFVDDARTGGGRLDREARRHRAGRTNDGLDERAHAFEMAIDGEGVRISRNGMCGDDESPQHAGMIVPHLFEEVVLDDRLGLVRGDGEMRGRHPIDEVALEHRGVAGDDATPLLRS